MASTAASLGHTDITVPTKFTAAKRGPFVTQKQVPVLFHINAHRNEKHTISSSACLQKNSCHIKHADALSAHFTDGLNHPPAFLRHLGAL